MYQLRDFQLEAVERTRHALKRGRQRILNVAPTGAGKTIISCRGYVVPAVERGRSVLFVVNRKQLVNQTSRKLDELGVVDHGILQANHKRTRYSAAVQVASKDTLVHRMEYLRHKPDLIIVDEAHHVTDDNSYSEIFKRWPDVPVIGLTATPMRLDGKPLGSVFDEMVVVSDIKTLIAEGYLVPPRVFAGKAPDTTGIRKVGGDWNQKQLAARTDTDELVGDIVETWKTHGEGRPTVCFALNVAHSRHIVASFAEAGIAAAHIDADTPDDEREETLGKLKRGDVKVCSSVGVFTEGFDCPVVGCVILARRTESLSLYIQMGGRGLRPANGIAAPGEDCIILDHANLTYRHGYLDDDRKYSLDAPCVNESQAKRRLCGNCGAAVPPELPLCPCCGSAMRNARGARQEDMIGDIPMGDGTILQELAREAVEAHRLEERRVFFATLALDAWAKGHKPVSVNVRFKGRFGAFPSREDQAGSRIKTEYRRDKNGVGAWQYVDAAEQAEMEIAT